MRFLIDAQLPPALARWLSDEGHPATHVVDVNLERADDRTIWDRAIEIGAVIVTKDEDFAVRKIFEEAGPAIVWVRFGNTTRREIISRFQDHLSGILEALARGEGLVEID
jgi:predicted nuclease of predicted toxin-antitoxin system